MLRSSNLEVCGAAILSISPCCEYQVLQTNGLEVFQCAALTAFDGCRARVQVRWQCRPCTSGTSRKCMGKSFGFNSSLVEA
jgi:hypothetical protein